MVVEVVKVDLGRVAHALVRVALQGRDHLAHRPDAPAQQRELPLDVLDHRQQRRVDMLDDSVLQPVEVPVEVVDDREAPVDDRVEQRVGEEGRVVGPQP